MVAPRASLGPVCELQEEEEFTMIMCLVGCICVKKKRKKSSSLIFVRLVVLFALNVLFCFFVVVGFFVSMHL